MLGGTELSNQGCGGALVGDKYVVTAAHCIALASFDASKIKVRVGDTSLDEEFEANSFTVDVKSFTNHPNFDVSTYLNDISVLELAEAVSLTEYPNIKPICLPEKNALFPGEATLAGWGLDPSFMVSYLNDVDLTVFPDGNCGPLSQYMTPEMICAGDQTGGKDGCDGDSGGPLVATDPERNNSMSLVGVGSGLGCANEAYAGLSVYTEVSAFVDWLAEQMSDLNTCPAPPEGWMEQDSNSLTTESNSPTTESNSPTTESNSLPTDIISSTADSGSCGNCVFPFVFNNRLSDRCTTMYGGEPWCATSVDSQGSMTEFEYCTDPSCPGLAGNSEEMSVHPMNAVGNCCKFFYGSTVQIFI